MEDERRNRRTARIGTDQQFNFTAALTASTSLLNFDLILTRLFHLHTPFGPVLRSSPVSDRVFVRLWFKAQACAVGFRLVCRQFDNVIHGTDRRAGLRPGRRFQFQYHDSVGIPGGIDVESDQPLRRIRSQGERSPGIVSKPVGGAHAVVESWHAQLARIGQLFQGD